MKMGLNLRIRFYKIDLAQFVCKFPLNVSVYIYVSNMTCVLILGVTTNYKGPLSKKLTLKS